jgi:hypothetical protein
MIYFLFVPLVVIAAIALTFFFRRVRLIVSLIRTCSAENHIIRFTSVGEILLKPMTGKDTDIVIATESAVYPVKIFGSLIRPKNIVFMDNFRYFIRRNILFIGPLVGAVDMPIEEKTKRFEPKNHSDFDDSYVSNYPRQTIPVVLFHPAPRRILSRDTKGNEILLRRADFLGNSRIFGLSDFRHELESGDIRKANAYGLFDQATPYSDR